LKRSSARLTQQRTGSARHPKWASLSDEQYVNAAFVCEKPLKGLSVAEAEGINDQLKREAFNDPTVLGIIEITFSMQKLARTVT
jgi:hypothetical protein